MAIKALTEKELQQAPDLIKFVYLAAISNIPLGNEMITRAETEYPEYMVGLVPTPTAPAPPPQEEIPFDVRIDMEIEIAIDRVHTHIYDLVSTHIYNLSPLTRLPSSYKNPFSKVKAGTQGNIFNFDIYLGMRFQALEKKYINPNTCITVNSILKYAPGGRWK